MSKMKPATGEEMIKAFEKRGWRIIRIRGSHHIMMKEGSFVTLSIPVHKGKTLPKGTQRGLIRDAGLTIEEFNRPVGTL